MFRPPVKPHYKTISRRRFLQLGGGVATALGTGSVAVGLNSMIVSRPVYAASSDDAKWRQFEGSKLVFMSENTPPSFAIRDNLKEFYDLTGIEVEILTDDLPIVQQKIGIDLRGGQADFQLNYIQDKPIGSPFADFYEDLTKYAQDDTLPQDPDGFEEGAWFDNFLRACGEYYEPGRIVAFPYDCAVACTFYRQDLFEQLSPDFEAEYGYRMEFNNDTTWKQVQDFSAYFTMLRNDGRTDIPYGYGQHHGTFAWTTHLDIQRMLFSHGRWTEFDMDDKLGSKKPGPTRWGDEQSVLMMEKYKALADVSHPDNLANGTLQLNTAYAAGDIAMQVQYHEFAASVEDASNSRAADGKTAYAPCPKGEQSWVIGDGDVVNGCNCGIGGIGINSAADEKLKRAAYLFANWSVSKSTQLNVLKELGGTPTRPSVLQEPDVIKARTRPSSMPNALTFDAVYDYGIKDPHFVLGPKIPEANEYYNILLTEVQRCVSGETEPEEACNEMKVQLDDLHEV
ncbi:MAG: extracellular solute-binding protein [Granulosicoccus sp.]